MLKENLRLLFLPPPPPNKVEVYTQKKLHTHSRTHTRSHTHTHKHTLCQNNKKHPFYV